MHFQRLIKIWNCLGSSIVLLAGLNGCSSTNNPTPVSQANIAMPPSASFSSSTVCTQNAFLQKYQCSFLRVEQAARAGDPDAQYALGYLYYYGIGTAQDRQTGLMWIRRAAAQGQPVAQQALQALSTTPSKATPMKTSLKPAVNNPVNTSPNPVSSSQSGNNVQSNISTNVSSSAVDSASSAPVTPDKPLTDYLPNYGEKRVDTTATPPLINLSAQPDAQN